MSEAEHMPTGGHRRQIDPRKIKKIEKGGKMADAIRKEAEEYHKSTDIPVAEDQLLQDLKKI